VSNGGGDGPCQPRPKGLSSSPKARGREPKASMPQSCLVHAPIMPKHAPITLQTLSKAPIMLQSLPKAPIMLQSLSKHFPKPQSCSHHSIIMLQSCCNIIMLQSCCNIIMPQSCSYHTPQSLFNHAPQEVAPTARSGWYTVYHSSTHDSLHYKVYHSSARDSLPNIWLCIMNLECFTVLSKQMEVSQLACENCVCFAENGLLLGSNKNTPPQQTNIHNNSPAETLPFPG